MAAFPTLKQSPKTRVIPISSGRQLDMSTNGTIRGRDLHSATAFDIDLVNILVTDAEKSTLETFYDTNKNLAITWTDAGDSQVYDAVFVAAPQYTWTSHGYWDVRTRLRGHQQ